jgi:hypothetical protein
MNKQKPVTAADYRKRRATSDRPTQLITVPSGFVWELRAPNILAYMATGRYPQSLVSKGLEAFRKNGTLDKESLGKEIIKQSSDEEIAETLIFMRQIVVDACVNPRIVVGGTGEDELDPVEVDPDDFRFIFKWCMEHGGVAGVDGLQSFRAGQERGTTVDQSDGPELRDEAVEDIAH